MIKKIFTPLTLTYNSNQHIPALDGIRGLAIVLVLLYHCFPSLYKIGTELGWIGVDLFFVLSGFLITGILLETKSRPYYFQTFFVRRVLRIFPLYYFFLIVFFLVLPLFTTKEWLKGYQYLYENQIWYWLYVPNWLIVVDNQWPPVSKPILNHFWSLAIEEQFYLFWPFVVYFVNKKVLKNICLYLILQSLIIRNIILSTGQNDFITYVFTFARLDPICVGSLCAVLIREEGMKIYIERITPFVLFVSVFLLGGIILLSKNLTLTNPYFIRIGYLLIAFMFGSFLIYALSKKNLINTVTQTGILRWFGKYSYGIYIYHWSFYVLFNPFFLEQFSFINNLSWRGMASSIVSTIIILLISVLSWHLFEKHILKLKGIINFQK